MSGGLAGVLVGVAEAYLTAGLLFAVPFVARWAGRLDPAARAGSLGFRLMILPGAALLWPLLARRLVRSR
jgi:hypothetical protein